MAICIASVRPFTSLACGLLVAACCPDSPRYVGLSVVAETGWDFAFLSVGDTATVEAVAYASTLMSECRLYDSRTNPTAFRFTSTDTSIATLDAIGFLRTRRVGQSYIEAVAAVVPSNRILLSVSPLASSLTVAATPTDARVGDSVQVRVHAFDEQGRELDSVYVVVAQVTPVGEFKDHRLVTPLTLLVPARAAGDLLITAFTAHEPVRPFLSSDTVRVRVRAS